MDANINMLRNFDKNIDVWGQPDGPPPFSELVMIDERIGQIAAQLQSGVSLDDRVEAREVLITLRDHLFSKAEGNPEIQRFIEMMSAPSGGPTLKDRINAAVSAIDEWSALHWNEDEEARREQPLKWAQLTPEQASLHRKTSLEFARSYIERLVTSRGVLDPGFKEQVARLVEQFPELRTELSVLRAIKAGHADLAMEFIAAGALLNDPSLLSEAVAQGDTALIETMLAKFAEIGPEKLKEVLTWRTADGSGVLDRLRIDINTAPNTLYRLVQSYKQLGLPPPTEPEYGILKVLSLMTKDSDRFPQLLGLFLPAVLDLLLIMPMTEIEKSLQVDGVPAAIDYWFSFAIFSYVHEEPPNMIEALRWFQRSEAVGARSPVEFRRCKARQEGLRDKLLPTLNSREHCGPFLESLGDLRLVLFDVDLFLHSAILDSESPLFNWLLENDPGLFAAQMSRENAVGRIPLHLAVKSLRWDSIGKLPDSVLRAGLDRPDHKGVSPLWLLLIDCLDNPYHAASCHMFEKMIQKLPPGKRALLRTSSRGRNMLHIALYRGSASAVDVLAKYPQLFLQMATLRNLAGQTPLSEASADNNFSSGVHSAICSLLTALNIPASALDAMQSSQHFVPWLRDQMRADPPPLNLLMLPILRGHPEEIGLALSEIPEACNRWFSTEQSITAMLGLPQDVWQTVLAVRSKAGNTTLERLADQGNSLFWTLLEQRDSDLPVELLRDPKQYGYPLHAAARNNQVDYLRDVMRLQEDNPDFQREILTVRDRAKRTVLQCAREAKNGEAETFLLREVEIPLLNRDLQLVSSAVGGAVQNKPVPNDLNGLRSECAQLSLQILDLQSSYFSTLRGKLESEALQPVFPSARQIETGAVDGAYHLRPVIGNEIETLPETVDFAGVLLPLIEQLPIGPNKVFPDEGRLFFYPQVKARLISVISSLAARGEVRDHYNNSLEPAFRQYITNVLRHLARHVETAQAEIAAAETPERRKELQDRLNKEMENELIGDFAIGFFNCVDGVAGHARQLYEHVIAADDARVGSSSVENQLLFAAQQYRRNQFDVLALQVASGNVHEATTLRHYRKLLGDRLGLGVTEMDKMDTLYTPFAVLGHEDAIVRDFNAEQTPKKLVDYFCGLLNDRHDKTLKKSMVSQWFSDRFPAIAPEQLQDGQGNWRPEAVGLLLTSVGIIKPKIEEVNAKTVLYMLIQQGDLQNLREPLAKFRGPLPDQLLHAAVRRGDPAIFDEVAAMYKRRRGLAQAFSARDENGLTAIELAVREAPPKFLNHLIQNFQGAIPITLLYHAVARGDIGTVITVKAALRGQNRISLAEAYREKGDLNPFELAVASGRFDIARLMLRDTQNPPPFSLRRIITRGNLASVEFALAEVRNRGEMEEVRRSLMSELSPLDTAAQLGKWDIVVRLLDGHPVRPQRVPLTNSPLLHALSDRRTDIALRLLAITPIEEIVDIVIQESFLLEWVQTFLQGERLEQFGYVFDTQMRQRAADIPDER